MQSYILKGVAPQTKQHTAKKQQRRRKNQEENNQRTKKELLLSGMVVSRPLKRVKRVVADYYSFHSFGTNACPAGDRTLEGPFRSNIKSFLLSYAEGPLPLKISSPPFIQRWRIRLRLDDQDKDVFIVLNIVEEDVKRSDSVYCDHCRVVGGWQENPVCKTRYHFIIQADNVKEKESYSTDTCPPQRCANCGADFVGFSASLRCKSCEDLEISRDTDLDDETRFDLEDTRHLLHGIIHVNGFGHLLRVNGREGGSQFLSGCDIMNLWDRICIMLKARKISVMDVSKKYGLDYRLLHAVQKGHPWYGNWGYEFGRGSFGTTHEQYKKALHCLSKLQLDSVLSGVGRYDEQLKQIISFYCSLSKNPLITVQDLVCFIMELLHKFHNQTVERKCSQHTMITKDKVSVNTESAESKWAPKVIDEITAAMLKVLLVADRSMWITWHDLKGATWNSRDPELLKYALKSLEGKTIATCNVSDPELLNYDLKSLEGKTIGKQIVQCQCNSFARTLEYRLKHINSVSIKSNYLSDTYPKEPMKMHVLEDLASLYHALLHPLPTDQTPLHPLTTDGLWRYGLRRHASLHPLRTARLWCYGLRKQLADASRNLMDCKQFIKDYEAKHPMDATYSESIRVFAVAEILDESQTLQRTPPELLIMSKNATVADLKQEAAQAFRDVYICFKNFQVENVRELQNIKDSTTLMLLVGPESVVTVQGHCYGHMIKYRAERGTQVWTVDCPCGTREDDGERMIACDSCEVWQHTRCIGISDTEDVPTEYMCDKCEDDSWETGVDSENSLPGSSPVSSFY